MRRDEKRDEEMKTVQKCNISTQHQLPILEGGSQRSTYAVHANKHPQITHEHQREKMSRSILVTARQNTALLRPEKTLTEKTSRLRFVNCLSLPSVRNHSEENTNMFGTDLFSILLLRKLFFSWFHTSLFKGACL